MGEEIRDTLTVVCSTNSLRENHTDVNDLVCRKCMVFDDLYQPLSNILTLIFEQIFIFSVCGIVLVTATASRSDFSILSMAGPEKIP